MRRSVCPARGAGVGVSMGAGSDGCRTVLAGRCRCCCRRCCDKRSAGAALAVLDGVADTGTNGFRRISGFGFVATADTAAFARAARIGAEAGLLGMATSITGLVRAIEFINKRDAYCTITLPTPK